jgi:3-oxoadipate enol-lactonase
LKQNAAARLLHLPNYQFTQLPNPDHCWQGKILDSMPTLQANGVKLFYKETGSGPETIVFSHGFLMDHSMFEPQRAAFEKQYRVIAYDHRAQGQSEDPGRGYDMSTVTDDAAILIRSLKAAPCHFVGLSMGGFVGMRLASRHPDLIRTLTLMNTTATREKLLNRMRYAVLAQMVKMFSPAPFASIAAKDLFGQTTRTSPEKRALLDEWTGKFRTRPRSVAYTLQAIAKRREFRANELAAIRCPTLIIAGEEDKAQPPRNSASLFTGIHGAHMINIPGAGHSSSLEQPDAVISAIRQFLSSPANTAANKNVRA